VKKLYKILTLALLITVSLLVVSKEDIDNELCESNSCLLGAVGEYKYCSLAPHNFEKNGLFRSQSVITISTLNKQLMIESQNGVHFLETPKTVELESYPKDEFSQAKELRKSKFTSPNGFSANYLFQGPKITDTPKKQLLLNDMKLFLDNGYALQLEVNNGGEIFPEVKDDVIYYTPCNSLTQGTDEFHFKFKDQSELKLNVRTADGADGHGYFVGNLLSAVGKYQGQVINIHDLFNLAMLGSTRSWSEVTIPTMVVKWNEHKGGCGIIFDKTQWYAEDSVAGYHAYSLNCDGERGVKLLLQSAKYNRRYQLP